MVKKLGVDKISLTGSQNWTFLTFYRKSVAKTTRLRLHILPHRKQNIIFSSILFSFLLGMQRKSDCNFAECSLQGYDHLLFNIVFSLFCVFAVKLYLTLLRFSRIFFCCLLAAILADKEGKEIEVLNPLEVSLRCRKVFFIGSEGFAKRGPTSYCPC